MTGDAIKKRKEKLSIDGDANADGDSGRGMSGDGFITDDDYADGSL